MQYRKLGRSELQVSVVAMGCWAVVGDATWGPQDEAEAVGAIKACLDHGITFFDTAEMYGNGASEALLGRALAGVRDQAVIASKVSADHLLPADVRAACERSLGFLKTDYIDLYQIHWPNWQIPFADTLGELEALKAEGKIRVIGVSNFGCRDLGDILKAGRVESNQMIYSALSRMIEWDIQPLCVQEDVSLLAYSPLSQGLLTGKFRTADEVPVGRARTRHFSGSREQSRHGEAGCEAEVFAAVDALRGIAAGVGCSMEQLALAWVLHQPGVASVLAGARSPQQVAANAAAGDIQLSTQTLAAIDQATGPVKAKLGSNPDVWQPADRSRIR